MKKDDNDIAGCSASRGNCPSASKTPNHYLDVFIEVPEYSWHFEKPIGHISRSYIFLV